MNTTTTTITTKIRFNGQEYASVDEMPLDVRQKYERALATVTVGTSGGLLNMLAKKHPPQGVHAVLSSKIVINGHEYRSADDMPADVRRVYQGVMAAVDADGNGVPDVLETAKSGKDQEAPQMGAGARLQPAASVAIGIRPEATFSRLAIAAVVIAIALLALSVFGR